MTTPVNASQQRILKVMLLLAGNEFQGLSNAEVAASLKEQQVNTYRDLVNLREAGLAEQLEETGRWRLGPKLVQVSLAFSRQLAQSEQRLAEISNRYTRGPTLMPVTDSLWQVRMTFEPTGAAFLTPEFRARDADMALRVGARYLQEGLPVVPAALWSLEVAARPLIITQE